MLTRSATRSVASILLLLLSSLALSACGYSIVQEKGIMGGQVVHLDVPVFKNKSFEPIVPEFFTEAFTRELVLSGLFEVNRGKSDSLLEGTILNVRAVPSTLSKDGIATQKTVFVDLGLAMVKKEGRLIKNWRLSDSEVYDAEPTNFEDFNRRAALGRVAARMARRFSALILTDIEKR